MEDDMKSNAGRRITLQDIARETGYSVNTVSRALRNMGDISPQTCASIQRQAREMGYTANQVASSLRSGRTHIFAVILGAMSNPFYGIMADTLQDAAQAAGYSLIIMCAREDAALEAQLVERAIARRVDGIILFPTDHSAPTVERLRAARMPFILMSRYLTEGAADSVVCDEARGAELAARHLIESGCRRLAYLSSATVVFSSAQRIAGFLRACDACGIAPEDRLVRVSDRNILYRERDESARRAALAEVLRDLRRQGFDGLFIFCDVEAWHALDVMQTADGLHAEDFGIVSFDNLEGALSFPIPLCSISCDYADMARRGIELLRARIHGDDRPPQTIVCPVELVCRGSCHSSGGNREQE